MVPRPMNIVSKAVLRYELFTDVPYEAPVRTSIHRKLFPVHLSGQRIVDTATTGI